MPSIDVRPFAQQIGASAKALWGAPGWNEVGQWGTLWAVGLWQLAAAADAALGPWQRLSDSMELIATGAENPVDPKLASEALWLDSVEHYHELAVLSLSQPLTDAIARSWLDANGAAAADGWWGKFLDRLERAGPDDLRDAARQVDVTLRIGRNLLAAHPRPGLTPVRPRNPDGRVVRTSRIDMFGGSARAAGFEHLRELNESVGPDARSPEKYIWQLVLDLQAQGRTMARGQRYQLRRAAGEVGFELDPAVGAAAMSELLGAIERHVLPQEEGSASPGT